MDTEKYNRTLSLRCPTCGGDQFEFEHGLDETVELAICASCGRTLTKDELIRENSELIDAQVEEIGDVMVKDAAAEMRKTLKNAFRGSKSIKIR